MKALGHSLALAAAMILGGCYTQLAITNDEPAPLADTPSTEVIQPGPTVVIIEPVLVPIAPPYVPLPVGGVSIPAPPAQSPSRDIGNHRTDSDRSGTGGSDTRTTGSTRGGR